MTEWFKARNVWGGAFEALSDAEAGRLAKALWKYTTTGEPADLPGAERAAYAMFILTLKQDGARESEISETRREAAMAGVSYRAKAKSESAKSANAQFAEMEPAKSANAQFAETEPAKSAFADNKKQNKNQNQNQRDINIGVSAGARAQVETAFGTIEVDSLIVKVQRELSGLTDAHYEELAHFRELLGDEMVSQAIDDSVGQGKRMWYYTRSILQRWLDSGFKTVGEVRAHEEQRAKVRPQGRTVSAQRYQQRDYAESDLAGSSADLLREAMAETN